MTASNGAFTSNSSEVLNITFDPANDVDDLVNASMTHLNQSAVYIVWHQIRNVDGYEVQVRLPPDYAIREPIHVKTTNVTCKLLLLFFDYIVFENNCQHINSLLSRYLRCGVFVCISASQLDHSGSGGGLYGVL